MVKSLSWALFYGLKKGLVKYTLGGISSLPIGGHYRDTFSSRAQRSTAEDMNIKEERSIYKIFLWLSCIVRLISLSCPGPGT